MADNDPINLAPPEPPKPPVPEGFPEISSIASMSPEELAALQKRIEGLDLTMNAEEAAERAMMQREAEAAAAALRAKNLKTNLHVGGGLLAGTAGLLGGIYGGKKLWEHYHQPSAPSMPAPPVPQEPDTEHTETRPMPEPAKQADDLTGITLPPRADNTLNALESVLLEHPVAPPDMPSSLSGYDLDFIPNKHERDALVQQLMEPEMKQANWMGDIGRRIGGASPEFIENRNFISGLGKQVQEDRMLEQHARRMGVINDVPPTPPEPSFLQKYKTPLIGAGVLGGAYLANQNGMFDSAPPQYKMGAMSSVVKRIAEDVKPTRTMAKVVGKTPPKPVPMAEKVTNKKPAANVMSTQEHIDAAIAKKRRGDNVPMAKVVPKTAAEQGYADMLARLGLYKDAAPVPPPKAIAASFKKAPELAKKTPPPVPPKAKKDFNDVQRTMGFSKNSAEAIKEAAFNAGYYDALATLRIKVAKGPKAITALTKKGPAVLAGPNVVPKGIADATYVAPQVPSAPHINPSPRGETNRALMRTDAAAQAGAAANPNGQRSAAPTKIDPSKAPLLRQGGSSGAPQKTPSQPPPPPTAKAAPTPPPGVAPVGSAAAPPAAAAAPPPAAAAAAAPPAAAGAAGPGFGQQVKDTWGKMPGWGKGLSIGGAAGLGGMGIGAAMQPDVNVYR